MITETTEGKKYYYIVHGTIPELTPDVLCRYMSEPSLDKRKILKCPHCGKRLTDTDIATRVELYRHPARVQVPCQFYMRCFYCKSEIGINIAI